jgi:hydrogenase maturation protein HypF
VRRAVRVEGIVQGVGFRPFVRALAIRLDLAGLVGNDAAGVFIEIEGDEAAVARFLTALEHEPPPLAVVERITVRPLPATGDDGFRIVASADGGPRHALVSPDTATCDDCLAEVLDPTDRRHRYAFTNCTNCGPRFSIVRAVPYDRHNTTMAGFAMCADCDREYHDPGDRRFHAQPTCCPACGPSLRLVGAATAVASGADDPILATARLLRDGALVAIKGIGGYHLAALASRADAVDALRGRKHREDKPFAVMVPDLEWACRLGSVGSGEEGALTSPARPIVLLERRPDAPVAAGVAPGNRSIGVMLPYTPLHHLLAVDAGEPFVLTSGNVSDEPIAFHDEDARQRLEGIADGFLVHDRPIHMRVDDSVVRVVEGRPMALRRSRGFAPSPVTVPWAFPRHVLACGAELKHTFAVAKDRRVFVSQHIGDLENYMTYRAFVDGVQHFVRLFDVQPTVIAHDLHPEYLSTKYATERDAEPGVDLVGVQHHHAHIASCLADHGEAGPVIGVAFDGLGFGPDGTIWGGEFLVASIAEFDRVGWIEPVPMPGGAAAIRQPWRMAAAHLDAAFGDALPDGLSVAERNANRWRDVVALARSGAGGVGAPMTSSAGRLFDAVAAILGVRDAINYEGQAAVELEQLADPSVRNRYDIDLLRSGPGPYVVPGRSIVAAVVAHLLAGEPVPIVAARFHRTVVEAIGVVCDRVRQDTGLTVVALSGGVFQNRLLTSWAAADLTARGFGVLTHSRVPPNDGGISLGQAVIACAQAG